MVKPRGAICNLDCSYCYYLDKEDLYEGSDFRMPDAVLESFTRQYIEAQPVPEVVFGWQGGEPTLMGLEFFKRAIELQERHAPPGTHVLNTLQTNGTRLDDDWCAFLARHGFLVGISLDGPAELHDAYRVDKGGRPTHADVMKGVDLLRRHGVEFNVLATVHAANQEHPLDVYRFVRDEVGSSFVQFIPIVERQPGHQGEGGGVVSERSVGGRAYGAFLSAIFYLWVRRDVGRMFVQIFDVSLAAWVGHSPGLCVFEETCGGAMALEHNGDLYSCDHFVDPDYLLGNVDDATIEELVSSERQFEFGQDKRDSLPQYCLDCDVRFACHGECPKNRFITTPDGEPGLNYLCAGFKQFFHHVDRPLKMILELMSNGRPASDVMEIIAREETPFHEELEHAGRNDPCPCGSGHKVKKCHGRVQNEPASQELPAHKGEPRPPVTERGRRAAERSRA